MIVDTKHIDSTEKALELGIHLVRHLPEPLENETIAERPYERTKESC